MHWDGASAYICTTKGVPFPLGVLYQRFLNGRGEAVWKTGHLTETCLWIVDGKVCETHSRCALQSGHGGCDCAIRSSNVSSILQKSISSGRVTLIDLNVITRHESLSLRLMRIVLQQGSQELKMPQQNAMWRIDRVGAADFQESSARRKGLHYLLLLPSLSNPFL